jgi:dimethylhistidine N-methyltransferase
MRHNTDLMNKTEISIVEHPALEASGSSLYPRTGIGSDTREILEGLRSFPKTISPKYFYDAEGSRLFEEICDLPEYYPTRSEISILEARAETLARRMGPNTGLIEYGSGSSRKTRILLDCFEPAFYMPIEISRSALEGAVRGLSEEYPTLPIHPVCADYMALKSIPTGGGEDLPSTKHVLFFPGSTIGNLNPAEALALLRRMRAAAGYPCALIIGVDLRKDITVLERAYNDGRGVTAAFNLNLLRRLNRELDAGFEVEAFRHHAFFNEEESRIEMHLVAQRDCAARIAGETIPIRAGESIHTENSYKYSLQAFAEMLRRAGFEPTDIWTDPRRYFGVFYAEGI